MKPQTFVPIKLNPAPPVNAESSKRVTVSALLKGCVAEEFEELREQSGLNRSQLIVQMVYHCLGRTEELKDFYRRLAILGK